VTLTGLAASCAASSWAPSSFWSSSYLSGTQLAVTERQVRLFSPVGRGRALGSYRRTCERARRGSTLIR
jgi:hypothetical protein